MALVLATVLAIVVSAGASPPATSHALANTVSGVVFYDKNGNGVRDPGEWGLPGIQLAIYEDLGNGVWQLRSDPGMHQTGSSGAYTFFISYYGTFHVRVVTLDFNPKADPSASNFEVDIRKNTVPAFQTATSAGSATLARTANMPAGTPNYVTAHCYDSTTGKVIDVDGTRMSTDYGARVPTQTCFGTQPWPYNNPPMPKLSADMDSPTYKLTNASGKVVPVYSTVELWSYSSPIPNADFGLATTADATPLKLINQGQLATLFQQLAQMFTSLSLVIKSFVSSMTLFR